MITCGNIHNINIINILIRDFLLIEVKKYLKSVLFFNIIFAILIIAKNNVYWITNAIDRYIQLFTKVSEFILNILMHVNTDINSVIIKIIIFDIIIDNAFIAFWFSTKIVNRSTSGSIINKLKNVHIFLVKHPYFK